METCIINPNVKITNGKFSCEVDLYKDGKEVLSLSRMGTIEVRNP